MKIPAEKEQYPVSVTLLKEEKQQLEIIAGEWGIRSGTIMRRLLQYFIDEKISLINVFKESNELKKGGVVGDNKGLFFIRTNLSLEEKQKLSSLVSEWDLNVSSVARRLLKLFITGKIARKSIW